MKFSSKKYAIRKLSIGVASVAIGFLTMQGISPESWGGVTYALEASADEIYTNKEWKPEGNIIAQGEDGVPWELYENGYLLFKPEPGKDTLSNPNGEGLPSWKTDYSHQIKAIGFSEKVYAPEDSSNLLATMGQELLKDVEYIEAEKLDTSNVKNMTSMFSGLFNLKKLDVSNWNTSNVTSMAEMFYRVAPSPKYEKDTDSSDSDYQIHYPSIDSPLMLDLSKWDTSKVKDMSRMFSFFNGTKLDLSKWNTSSLENTREMFFCSKIYNLGDLSKWNTSKLKNMGGMFQESNIVELNINDWDVSNVENMDGLFYLTKNITKLDLGKWNTSNVKYMTGIFSFDRNLKYLDITNWDTKNVEEIEDVESHHMFDSNLSLTHLKLGNKFANTKLSIKLFNDLDKHRYGDRYTEKWSRLDESTPFYTVDEWNTEYRANPEKLAGMWVREKNIYNMDGNEIETSDLVDDEMIAYSKAEEKFDSLSQKYHEAQSKTEEKANIVKKIDEEIQEFNLNIQKAYLISMEAERAYNKNGKKPADKQKMDEANKNIKDLQDKLLDKQKEFNNAQAIDIPTPDQLAEFKKDMDIAKSELDKIIELLKKGKLEVATISSPIKYEKDNTREKGQENITIQGKDGSKTTIITYTVDKKTGKITAYKKDSLVIEPTETIVKVAAKDKVEIVNKDNGTVVKETTSYTINEKTGEITETKTEEYIKNTVDTSKGEDLPPIVESLPEFSGGVNATDAPVVENLLELKVAVIKDKENNILDVIKETEKPKDIQGYKNTSQTEIDKDGYKVYIYEKVEAKQDSTVDRNKQTNQPKPEEKEELFTEENDNNKDTINKKTELPKTSASLFNSLGLLVGFGLLKRKKD